MTNDPAWRKRLREKDPEAVRALNRRYYKSDAGQAAIRRKYQRKREMVLAERKRRGDACQDCSYLDDLVWHHRDPSLKSFTIGYSIIKSYVAVEAELAKCDLLCPNCHARRHRLDASLAARRRDTSDDGERDGSGGEREADR